MFESNPKTIGDMMAVVNKHADMEDTERAHRWHKTQNDSSECPRQQDNRPERRCDDRPPRHNKKHDRTESSKSRDHKRGPENTIAIAERSQLRSTLNQADLDRLLGSKSPWHKDVNHTTRECRALSTVQPRTKTPSDPAAMMATGRVVPEPPGRALGGASHLGKTMTSAGKINHGISKKKTGPSTSSLAAPVSHPAGADSS
jgi:hypothetical protein